MLSVLIATRDDEPALALTLALLVPAAAAGIVREVVIADGGSKDGTGRIADATGCVFLSGPDGEGARLRQAAASSSRGEWLLVLKPGTILDPDWHREAMLFIERVERHGRAASRAAVFRYGVDDDDGAAKRWQGGLARLERVVSGLPRPSQGLLISRTFYRSLGGHHDLPILADVDLLRRIGRRRIVTLRSRASAGMPDESPALARFRRALSRGLAARRVPARLLVRLYGG